jgi:hypothetical protein
MIGGFSIVAHVLKTVAHERRSAYFMINRNDRKVKIWGHISGPHAAAQAFLEFMALSSPSFDLIGSHILFSID